MKHLKNLGKSLNKVEQKSINGGGRQFCESHKDCPGGQGCCAMAFCVTDEYYSNNPHCSSSF